MTSNCLELRSTTIMKSHSFIKVDGSAADQEHRFSLGSRFIEQGVVACSSGMASKGEEELL